MKKVSRANNRKHYRERLDKMAALLDEIAEDNTAVVGAMNRILEHQEGLRADLMREVSALREEFAGALVYRALKDICREMVAPLIAMEAMVQQADFTDAATIRGHVDSLAITLRSVLSRMGAEKIPITPGAEIFDAHHHLCVQLITPAASPFPSAPPRTIVYVVEDGYTLADYVLTPAKVAVQAETGNDKLISR